MDILTFAACDSVDLPSVLLAINFFMAWLCCERFRGGNDGFIPLFSLKISEFTHFDSFVCFCVVSDAFQVCYMSYFLIFIIICIFVRL